MNQYFSTYLVQLPLCALYVILIVLLPQTLPPKLNN